MRLNPVVTTLFRHKTMVALILVQVSFTTAISCNVLHMIAHRVALTSMPTGLNEDNLVLLRSEIVGSDEDPLLRHKADLAELGAISGVESAAAVDTLPLSKDNWIDAYSTVSDQQSHSTKGVKLSASLFNGTPGELATLGIKLVDGRDFSADDFVPMEAKKDYAGETKVDSAIITSALASRLFPGVSAVGRYIYSDGSNHPVRIIGVAQTLLRPSVKETQDNNYSILFPMLPDDSVVYYAIRTSKDARDRVLRDAQTRLMALNNHRILRRVESYSQLREEYFRRDRVMLGLLIAAGSGLLLVTALGITGLASFWVRQRRRTIGIRRAVGATKQSIVFYFLAENALIVSTGVVLGMALACWFSRLLMTYFEVGSLPIYYLPIGSILLFIVSQLAVLGPALKAGKVPPIVVMRGT